MSDEARGFVEAILELSEDDQKEALEVLWERLQPRDESGRPRVLYGKEWAEEIQRRIDDGRAHIPGEQVLEQAKDRLRARAKAKAR